MRIERQLIALAVSVCLCGGCATARSGSFATRFVKSGEPAVDVGGPELSAKGRDPANKATPHPAPHPATLGTSIENSDPRLSTALLAARVTPTPESHLRVALEYERLGILDSAAAQLQLALKQSPRFVAAHEELARVWREWGLPQYGLSSAYRAVYLAPQSATAHNTLGTLLSALGQADGAEQAYRRALVLQPQAFWALNNLCDLERRRGRAVEARSLCEAALRIAPSLSAAHNNLALVLASTGDLAGARREFLAAGDPATAEYNIGIVHLANGNYQAAATAFEDAIRLRPDFTAAKERAHIVRMRLLTGGN